MTGFDLQDFFQLGFHAAALVFLFLGYQLLKKVVETDGDALPLKLKNVRFFMYMSLAFFLVGAGLQFFEGQAQRRDEAQRRDDGGERELALHLSPAQMPEDLPRAEVTLAGTPMEFVLGRAELVISQDTDMRINLEKLRDALVGLRAVNRDLQLEKAAALPDVGVGDDGFADEMGLSDEGLREADTEELDATAARLNEALEQPGTTDPSAIRSTLGWVHYTRGDLSAATTELERAAAEALDETVKTRAFNNLGRVLLERGDLEGSRQAFEKAGPGAAAREGLGQVVATEKALRVAN